MTVTEKPFEKRSGRELLETIINCFTYNKTLPPGKLKWHTLRSCMLKELLIACPEIDLPEECRAKINVNDVVRILREQPQLGNKFNWKVSRKNKAEIFIRHPHAATAADTADLTGTEWAEVLAKRPELSHLCSFDKFYIRDWIALVSCNETFADKCPWSNFGTYDWEHLVSVKKSCLKFLTPKYWYSLEKFEQILSSCYEGKSKNVEGIFKKYTNNGEQLDAATFLINKNFDKTNAKLYLNTAYTGYDWSFLEELCDLSPADAVDVYEQKSMMFYLTLNAPDRIFEKILPLIDPKIRDAAGNNLLLPALICKLNSKHYQEKGVDISGKRYDTLIELGVDPDQKNLAGFSCNDFLNSYLNADKSPLITLKIKDEEYVIRKDFTVSDGKYKEYIENIIEQTPDFNTGDPSMGFIYFENTLHRQLHFFKNIKILSFDFTPPNDGEGIIY